MQTITIGWTKISTGKIGDSYVPYLDGYRPGAAQHREVITVPTEASLIGTAEAVYIATNHPEPETLQGLAGEIRDAIAATGYRGEQAHYSLSIGDTVEVRGRTLACGHVGWNLVETS